MLAIMTTENTDSILFDISPPKIRETTGYAEVKPVKVEWGPIASLSVLYAVGIGSTLMSIIVNADKNRKHGFGGRQRSISSTRNAAALGRLRLADECAPGSRTDLGYSGPTCGID